MRRWTTLCAIMLALLTVAGCASASHVDFIPEGPAYTHDGLSTALAEVDAGAAADVKSEDAPQVRQEALANLRQHGNEAASLADAITESFPTDSQAVPFRVEKGSYDAEPAWVVYEAWGEPGEKLTHKRVWVFSLKSMDILAALSVR